jgi:outer membrane protein TolC
VRRPELALFDAQIRSIQARKSRLDASVMPRLGLFATGGYGKPGLNMLANRFETYYVVGARLSWNIGRLYTRRDDRRRILSDIRGVELRRDVFLLGTELDISQRNNDIERCREQLHYDDEIIALRLSVLRSSEAKMAGGTISGSDLARDINAAQAAQHDKIVHEMELLTAIFNLRYATNN